MLVTSGESPPPPPPPQAMRAVHVLHESTPGLYGTHTTHHERVVWGVCDKLPQKQKYPSYYHNTILHDYY